MLSSLEITTPTSTSDLTLRATLKTELQISGTTEDDYLSDLIRRASDAMTRWCGRATFGRESYRQTLRLDRALDCIILDRDLNPTISSVTVDGTALTADEYLLQGLLLYRLVDDEVTPWTGRKVVIEYAAGWLLMSDVPYEVERAALAFAVSLYEGRGRDPLLRSGSAEGVGQESYVDPRAGLEDLPPQVAATLVPYLRQGMG